MTEEQQKPDGPRHVVARHAKIAGKIVRILRRAEQPPAEIEKLANKLVTELSQVKRPASRSPAEQRSHIEALTRTVCDRLSKAEIWPGEIYDVSVGILEGVGRSFVSEPDKLLGLRFGAAVDDYLCPPCDADFEYLSESD
jgi:hypothetical protein